MVRGLCVLFLLGGCPDSSEVRIEGPVEFECVPGADPSESSLHRLTRIQYHNTLTDLLTASFSADEATRFMSAIEAPLSAAPGESSEDIGRVDHTLAQEHVDSFYLVAWGLSQLLTDSDHIDTLLGACASIHEPSCVGDFLDTFGFRVLRRPIRDSERQFYLDIYGDHAELNASRLADMLAVLLTAPHFIYQIEDDGTPVNGQEQLIEVSPYALASRLSYHFWQTMPDEALFAAAADGRLSTAEGYTAEVERIFHHPRTRQTLDGFFHQWLHLEEVPPLDGGVGTPQFDAFAGTDLPGPELREEMINEVTDFIGYAIWDHPGTFHDLFSGEQSFAKSSALAQLYEIPPWVEGNDPPTFPAGQRPGILGRAAFLSTGTTKTQPIHKGVFIRRKILCDILGDPPADLGEVPEVDPLTSRRVQTETLTESEGSTCLVCHERINHLGYPTESFDALGRFRAQESIFGEDGELLAEPVVDTHSIPQVLGGDKTPAQNLLDLNSLILESGKAEACMARHYFRFAYARVEDLAVDGCALEPIRTDLANGVPLAEALKNVALQPEFKLRLRGDS